MSATGRGSKRANLDDYRTPDLLAARLIQTLGIKRGETVLEPHVGSGSFARAVNVIGARVIGIDLNLHAMGFDYCRLCFRGQDFLNWKPTNEQFNYIVGNPPYGSGGSEALDHVLHAIEIAKPNKSVAFLLRMAMLESRKRVSFWLEHPCYRVYPIVPRPSFTKGGTDATAYGWFWWNDSKRQGAYTELFPPLVWR